MVRSIIAVIVSYITMFVLNFLGFVGLYAIVGPSQHSGRACISPRTAGS